MHHPIYMLGFLNVTKEQAQIFPQEIEALFPENKTLHVYHRHDDDTQEAYLKFKFLRVNPWRSAKFGYQRMLKIELDAMPLDACPFEWRDDDMNQLLLDALQHITESLGQKHKLKKKTIGYKYQRLVSEIPKEHERHRYVTSMTIHEPTGRLLSRKRPSFSIIEKLLN